MTINGVKEIFFLILQLCINQFTHFGTYPASRSRFSVAFVGAVADAVEHPTANSFRGFFAFFWESDIEFSKRISYDCHKKMCIYMERGNIYLFIWKKIEVEKVAIT